MEQSFEMPELLDPLDQGIEVCVPFDIDTRDGSFIAAS